jgi:hypothetical protein
VVINRLINVSLRNTFQPWQMRQYASQTTAIRYPVAAAIAQPHSAYETPSHVRDVSR